MSTETPAVFRFKYKNHRGEISDRRIIRPVLHFGDKNAYYPPDIWFISGHDLDKEARRTFAVRNILEYLE